MEMYTLNNIGMTKIGMRVPKSVSRQAHNRRGVRRIQAQPAVSPDYLDEQPQKPKPRVEPMARGKVRIVHSK